MKTAVTECSMNKELFVSSTPHETKVGLVEDDLLAEIYLERENEYTLAGSIYKGRVTRVLPGMQSAFVDIGLERDAFLYVSDFMDLEEHDDDLTEVVPTSRGVQDLRQQQAPEGAQAPSESSEQVSAADGHSESDAEETPADADAHDQQGLAGAERSEQGNGGEPQGRDRGWRGRRRRRGGRRERGFDRPQESRYSRPAESAPARPTGPPAGYEPILLPGESISKYRRYSQPAPAPETSVSESTVSAAAEPASAVAATFPEDEPIFAAGETSSEPLHEEHEDLHPVTEEAVESAATSANWNREFRRTEDDEEVKSPAALWESQPPRMITDDTVAEEHEAHEIREPETAPDAGRIAETDPVDQEPVDQEDEKPVFAVPGTMEEET